MTRVAASTAAGRSGFGVWPTTKLMFRRHRVGLFAWTVPLLLMVAIAVPAYQSTYPGLEERAPLVTQMQNTDGMRVLYGIMHSPGTLGQLFSWEIGSYVVILTCVMALLLAVSTTRGEEEAGTLELVRASGVAPVAPLVAAMILVVTACGLVSGGSTMILLLQMGSTDELTTAGALGFGAVNTLAGVTVGLTAMLFAQLRGEARGARSWAFIFVGATFFLRILADQAIAQESWPQWLKALNWLSPFGWKEVVSPYTQDRGWPLAVFAGVCVLLVLGVVVLHSRREYSASTLPDRSTSPRGVRVGSVEGWSWLAGRSHVTGWSAAVVLAAVLFGSMTGGLVQTLRDSEPTRQLLEQMSGAAEIGAAPSGVTADDVAAAAEALSPHSLLGHFYEFLGFYVALLVAIFAILTVLTWRGEEKHGYLDLELTTGTRRWRSLLARCTLAMIASVSLLVVSAALMGWLGEMQMADDVGSGEAMRQSMASTLGQAPAVLAGIGIAALLIAVLPRRVGLIWAVVALSAFFRTFGGLVDIPQWILDLSLYGWAPSVGEDWPWAQMVLLMVIGIAGMAVAAALVGRRDVTVG